MSADVYDVLRGMINDYIGRDNAAEFMRDFERRMGEGPARCDALSEIARELRDDYPAVDVTTVVFSRDFVGVGCCVIPQERVLKIIEALSVASAQSKSAED